MFEIENSISFESKIPLNSIISPEINYCGFSGLIFLFDVIIDYHM